DLPADLVTQASASISETIQVVNSLGGDEHLLSSAKLAFSASHSLVLGTASVLLRKVRISRSFLPKLTR
ncbi:hypothetical protein N4360_005489, partial [Klebsiella pneumoniae]